MSPGAGANATGPGVTEYRRMTSETMFRGHGELRILHAGQEYRLSITSKGKLILTK